MGERLVYVKDDEATQRRKKARLRGREALVRLADAEREYREAQEMLDRELGPDPRRAFAEVAIQGFCDAIVGRPSIRPA